MPKLPPNLVDRYNIAASQLLTVIGTKAGGHRGGRLPRSDGGFIPHNSAVRAQAARASFVSAARALWTLAGPSRLCRRLANREGMSGTSYDMIPRAGGS